ncbi:MAG: methyl-accepting chemotaxis protein [Spirochaetales bacterium]|nr:methyl-accepting chemotaxis protein [Spirochaetales bacterium]
MVPELERFREQYDIWRSHSRTIIENARSVAVAVQERNTTAAAAIAAFDAMRDHIDRMGELIERQFAAASTLSRQRELGEALSLVLNGDRDAYQAYVAQLLALEATNIDDLLIYDESNAENLQQTLERVNRAADLSGVAAQDLRIAFQEQYATWSTQSRRILELTLSSFETQRDTEDVSVLSAAAFQEMRDAIDVLGGMQETRAVMMIQQMERRISRTLVLYSVVVLLSFLLSIVVSIFIARSILHQLGKDPGVIAAITDSIANGNLAIDFDADRKKLVGVYASMKRMTEDLKRIIGEIDQSARNVASSSQQLNESAQQMSQGATEQAANAEEVSSSMEEMASNISQNTDNALQTEKIARQVARDAEEGGNAVHETVAAMQQIAEKISIIEEIARNTNLLALNAAIEAARAGDHGKGFAVVASEVRKLAERSQKAAGEIGELSSSSVAVAENAGTMLESIVPNVRKTAELVQEIAAASTEQKTGADQINQAIIQLDYVIQQNASSSEEMASMAEELSAQAENMNTVMQFFTLDEDKPRLLTAPGDAGTSGGAARSPEGWAPPRVASERVPENRRGLRWGVEDSLGTSRSKETGVTLRLGDDPDFEEM